MIRVSGGCHCGAVRFEAEAEAEPEVLDCNCSICGKTGYVHLFIPHERFTLLTDRAALISYRFGTGFAEHLFCSKCGIKSFYQPRSHPDCWSVNLRCLDPSHSLKPSVVPFDGSRWSPEEEFPGQNQM